MTTRVMLAKNPISQWGWITEIKTKEGLPIWVTEEVAATAQEAEKMAKRCTSLFRINEWLKVPEMNVTLGWMTNDHVIITDHLNPSS